MDELRHSRESERIIPLSRQLSLQAQAYRSLRSAILLGELIPGARLIETQLAKRLQVSRTPVREALRQLQQEHLVTVDVTGTLRVAMFSKTDALQLFGCRMALEKVAVASACQSVTEAQLQALYQVAVEGEDLTQSDSNYQFHRLIAKSADNFWLMALLDQVFDKMVLLRIQTLRNSSPGLDVRCSHRDIYEAIAHRNSQTAIDAMSVHLSESRDRVIQAIEEFHPML